MLETEVAKQDLQVNTMLETEVAKQDLPVSTMLEAEVAKQDLQVSTMLEAEVAKQDLQVSTIFRDRGGQTRITGKYNVRGRGKSQLSYISEILLASKSVDILYCQC